MSAISLIFNFMAINTSILTPAILTCNLNESARSMLFRVAEHILCGRGAGTANLRGGAQVAFHICEYHLAIPSLPSPRKSDDAVLVCLFACVCVCVSGPVCSHVTPAADCEVTVCAQVAIVYLVQQAS